GAVPVAMTFDPHPRSVVRHETVPLLQTLPERIASLREAGAESVRVMPFYEGFSQLPPEEFLSVLLHGADEVTAVCVGSQWRFGAKAAGNAETLRRAAADGAFIARIVPEAEDEDGRPVSSTVIREHVAAADFDGAARRLGRRFETVGTVESGFQAARRDLHCPTANLGDLTCALPPDGVYAVRAGWQGRWYPAAANLGFAPTYDRAAARRRLEVHLLDFSGDLYGGELRIDWIKRLRPEQRFATPALLKEQIAADVAAVRRITAAGGRGDYEQ
ncbi:MAG: bifunctional riboflavin kinase/FAD synthetase, partial [Lentisphaeria bacterium]|nr:bifunctional riboflavin kinase/FAD synthetase [Lentisphaeria bacterium]